MMDTWDTARRIVHRYRLHVDVAEALERDIADAIDAARIEGPRRSTIEPLRAPEPALPLEMPDGSRPPTPTPFLERQSER
jgi:hypothetical protein